MNDEPGIDPGPDYTDCAICGHSIPFEDLDDNGVCLADDCQAEAEDEARAFAPDYFDAPEFSGEPMFADPGGRSALRAASRENPRIHPCPSCGAPGRLTPADVARGYQCDACADRAERGW